MADIAKNLMKIILGILLVVIALWIGVAAKGWGQATVDLIQGGIILTIILVGLVLGLIGLMGFKD